MFMVNGVQEKHADGVSASVAQGSFSCGAKQRNEQHTRNSRVSAALKSINIFQVYAIDPST